MILHEINQKMPIYRDCTLGEIMFVGAMIFLIETLIFSLVTKLLFGYAFIGVAITFIGFFHTTKYYLNKLQKLKYGKPYGYYQQLLIKKLSDMGLIKGLYITRIGRWSVRRVG